jgi:tRNA threonylcarbamoyladenosine biosynthesis protein TsaB
MRILAIDTTTKFLCLGIYDKGKIYEYNLEVARKLSELLHISIKRTLEAAGLKIKDIDYFACGIGPGSFTGMRVGVACVKGLSWSLRKPLIAISTLDILARCVKSEGNPIAPVIDAKRNLIYCSFFKIKGQRLQKLKPYMLLSEAEFFKLVMPNSILLGDALSLYKDKILENIKGVRILEEDYWYPKPRNILELALEKIKNKNFVSPFDIEPIYLYPKECQIVKSQKEKGKSQKYK